MQSQAEVMSFSPRSGSYEAPSRFALVSRVVRENPELCLDASWPENDRATLTIRRAGSCKNQGE